MVNCTRYDGSCNVGLYFQILKILEFLEAHYRQQLAPVGTYLPPPQKKLHESHTPPYPLECPNTLTIIITNFFLPPLDGRNFLYQGIFSGMTNYCLSLFSALLFQIDFSTTYSQNHHELEQSHDPQADKFNGRWRTSIYKVCNGMYQNCRSMLIQDVK